MSNLGSASCACQRQKTSDKHLSKEVLKVFGFQIPPPPTDTTSEEIEPPQGYLASDESESSEEPLTPDEQLSLPRLPFTVFDEQHMKAVHGEADELSKLGHKKMIQKLTDLKNRHPNSNYVDYLSRISLLKHEKTRDLPLPPAYQTIPGAFFNFKEDEILSEESNKNDQITATSQARGQIVHESKLDPELKLNWWREDPGLAEHHYSWHLNYPHATDRPEKDRQGELFAYMHEQMLARYNAERLGVGLPPVSPFGPGIGWDRPLIEGYNIQLEKYSFRPAAMTIPESAILNETRHLIPSVMKTQAERLFIAIARNYLEDSNGNKVELSMDKLGCSIESNMGSVNKKLYGNIHNDGHCILSVINDPHGTYDIKNGPMIDTTTAPKDPVFFRWHKFVDSVFEAFRTTKTPYAVKDLMMESIEVKEIAIESGKPHETNQLRTWMLDEEFETYKGKDKKKVTVAKSVMTYKPFTYAIKMKNSLKQDATLVFRIFLAPTKIYDDLEKRRNDFIELDRFVEIVEGGSERTITRRSEDSSVLVPPAHKVQHILDEQISDAIAPCGCGWPRNLLIPRGTEGGMRADLYVLATNWKEDEVSPRSQLSGSVSYCGKKDEKYPDRRPMGFPFDRAMGFETLSEMVDAVPNSSTTKVDIVLGGQ